MKTKIALIIAMGLALTAPAFAIPVTGVIGSANNYSVVHPGAHPSGSGEFEDWQWFDAGQRIQLLLEDGILLLAGEQTFSLNVPSNPEAAASITFTELLIDLNDDDGFGDGSYLDYTLDGVDGTIDFLNENYGQSQFNSSSWQGSQLIVSAWGGDTQNDLGMDIVIIIPEPGVIALFLIGLAGVTVSRRRPPRV